MKDKKELIEKLINIQIGYYKDREEIRKYLKDKPVILAMLESYTERIQHITNVIIDDILEIPEKSKNKYDPLSLERGTAIGIIDYTISNNGKYKNSTIELLLEWENTNENIDKVSFGSWFYYEELLEEHSKGFPAYQKKIEEEKEKKKNTRKTTA